MDNETLLFAVLVTVLPVLSVSVVRWLHARRERLCPSPGSWTYYDRFIKPQLQRAWSLGIPDDEIKRMYDVAWEYANPTIIGQAPMSRFAAMIDQWEAQHKPTGKRGGIKLRLDDPDYTPPTVD